jgi:hypothetical protein
MIKTHHSKSGQPAEQTLMLKPVLERCTGDVTSPQDVAGAANLAGEDDATDDKNVSSLVLSEVINDQKTVNAFDFPQTDQSSDADTAIEPVIKGDTTCRTDNMDKIDDQDPVSEFQWLHNEMAPNEGKK